MQGAISRFSKLGKRPFTGGPVSLDPCPSSAELVRITLSEPPSANRYWRVVNGRPIVSHLARLYKAAAALSALAQGIRTPITEPCAVTLRWFRSRKSGDLDNRIKIVLDSLQGVLYVCDSQIVELHAYRADDKSNPRVEITLSPISEARR